MKTKEELMVEMLFEAIEKNNREDAKGLIAMGVDVNTKNDNGITLLHGAAMLNRLTIADMLIEAGADANATDNTGRTPLKCALNESTQMKTMLEKAMIGLKEYQEEKIKNQIRSEIRKKNRES
jgi:ankyrin repeat protein